MNNAAEQAPTEKGDTTTLKSDPSVTLTELKAEKEVDEKDVESASATSSPEAPKDHSEDEGEDEATTPGVPLCTDAPVAEGDGGSRDENTPTTSVPACSEPPPGGGGTPVYDGKPKINPVGNKKTSNKVVKEDTKSFLQTDNAAADGDDNESEKVSSKDDQNNSFLSTSEEKGQQHDAEKKADEHEDFDIDDYDELNHHLDPHHDYSYEL